MRDAPGSSTTSSPSTHIFAHTDIGSASSWNCAFEVRDLGCGVCGVGQLTHIFAHHNPISRTGKLAYLRVCHVDGQLDVAEGPVTLLRRLPSCAAGMLPWLQLSLRCIEHLCVRAQRFMHA